MTSNRATNKFTRFLSSKKGELISSYVQIVLGCLIGGAAYPLFMTENRIAPGGLTGVATILNHLFGLPVGITSLVMNVPLFIIGFRAMGKIFVFRSLVATALFSVFIDILPLETMTTDPCWRRSTAASCWASAWG